MLFFLIPSNITVTFNWFRGWLCTPMHQGHLIVECPAEWRKHDFKRACMCICVNLSQAYRPCDRHSATEMSWGTSPNVLTIGSVCVSDREWLGDTEGALCWVDNMHANTHTHPRRGTHMHTLKQEDSALFLSLCAISHSLFPWRRETQSFTLCLLWRRGKT